METPDAQTRERRVLELLERAAAAVCLRPGDFRLVAEVGNAATRVRLVAGNLTDRNRLVGMGRSNVMALAALAALMSDGRVVHVEEVEAATREELPKEPFARRKDWPRARVHDLLVALVVACFERRDARVEWKDKGPGRTQWNVVLAGPLDGRALRFGRAAATLAVSWSIPAGHRLYVDVRSERR